MIGLSSDAFNFNHSINLIVFFIRFMQVRDWHVPHLPNLPN